MFVNEKIEAKPDFDRNRNGWLNRWQEKYLGQYYI